jgi:TP901 family phage tail tape measure protein
MANEVQITLTAKDLASGKISKLQKGIRGVNSTLEKHQRSMLMAGAAAVAFGTVSVKAAADFDRGMREVNTLINFSNTDLDVLKHQVRDLSKEFGINAVEAAKALYSTISAGTAPADAIKFLTVAAKTSIGGITDLETAVDGLTSVVNAFGYEAHETEDVADIMFATMRRGKTTIAELSRFFFQAAPVASALGVSLEETSAAITTLTLSGTPTRVAMTQVRQAMVSLATPTAEMEKLFEAVGYESGLAAIRADGLVGAFNKLQKQSGATETEFIKAVGSVESLQAVMGLTGKNTPAFLENMKAMENAAGGVEDAYAQMADSTSQKFEEMTAAMNDAKIEMGENLTPLFEQLADVGVEASEAIGENQGLTMSVLALTATVGGVAILRIAITNLAAAFTALKVATGFLTGIVGAVGAGTVAMLALIVGGIEALIRVSNDAITMSKESQKEFAYSADAFGRYREEINGVTMEFYAMGTAMDLFDRQMNRREAFNERMDQVAQLEAQFINFEKVVGFVATEVVKSVEDMSDGVEKELEEISDIIAWQEKMGFEDALKWAEDKVKASDDRFAREKEKRWKAVDDEKAAAQAAAQAIEDTMLAHAEFKERVLKNWALKQEEDRIAQEKAEAEKLRKELENLMQRQAFMAQADEAAAAVFENMKAYAMSMPAVYTSNLGRFYPTEGGGSMASGTATAMSVLNSQGARAGIDAGGLFGRNQQGEKVHIVNVNVAGSLMGSDVQTEVEKAMHDSWQRGQDRDADALTWRGLRRSGFE